MNANDNSGNDALSKFMSTHPINNDRIAAMQKMMPEAQQYYKNATPSRVRR